MLTFLSFIGIERKRLVFPVFRYNMYSQNGEDGIIEFIVKKMATLPKFVVDIGANDGITSSNSRMLINTYSFKGLLIEPYNVAFEKLKTLYKDNDNVVSSKQAVGTQKVIHGKINWHGHFEGIEANVKHVNDVLEENNTPKDIGFLSIDIDGNDNEVLAAIDWNRFSPYFVIAEIASSSSRNLQDQINIMYIAGYIPLFHIGNVFYGRKDIVGEFLFNWKLDLPYERGFFIK